MKLSLSGRIIEVEYKYCQWSVEEFLKLAKGIGYDAVELRRTQISAETPPEEVQEIKEMLQKYDIGVSRLPAGEVKDDESFEGLGTFADMAVELRCPFLSVGFGSIPWAQKAADYLKERGLSIAIQTHTGGLFETPDVALKTLKQINRDHFGLMYDSANFFLKRVDYVRAVEQLKDYLFLVSVQCLAPAAAGEEGAKEYEGLYYKRHLLGKPGGMDFEGVFKALHRIGFEGYVTVIEPISELMDNLELARAMFRELRRLIG